MSEIAVNPRKTLCPTCGDKARVVLDHSVGDLICTTCGLVLEDHCIDDGQEWRNFGYEGVENGQRVNERERADRSNAHDQDGDDAGTTTITGTSAFARDLQRYQNMAESAAQSKRKRDGHASTAKIDPKHLKVFTSRVREVCGRLNLGEEIVNRCIALFQDICERDETKAGARSQVTWYCALVHIATVQKQATRTVREMAEANAGPAGKNLAHFGQQIEKRVKEIEKALGFTTKPSGAYVEDAELMARLVSRLELSPEVCKPASHLARAACQYGLTKQATQYAIVATSIFIVAWLLNVEAKPRFTDVSAIAKVPEAAVRTTYKAISPHVRRLLPDNFVCRLRGGEAALPQA